MVPTVLLALHDSQLKQESPCASPARVALESANRPRAFLRCGIQFPHATTAPSERRTRRQLPTPANPGHRRSSRSMFFRIPPHIPSFQTRLLENVAESSFVDRKSTRLNSSQANTSYA